VAKQGERRIDAALPDCSDLFLIMLEQPEGHRHGVAFLTGQVLQQLPASFCEAPGQPVPGVDRRRDSRNGTPAELPCQEGTANGSSGTRLSQSVIAAADVSTLITSICRWSPGLQMDLTAPCCRQKGLAMPAPGAVRRRTKPSRARSVLPMAPPTGCGVRERPQSRMGPLLVDPPNKQWRYRELRAVDIPGLGQTDRGPRSAAGH
jgi:hypothetical protein